MYNCFKLTLLSGLLGIVLGSDDISIVIGNVGAHATVNIYVSDAVNASSTQSPSNCPSPAPYPTLPPINDPNVEPTMFPTMSPTEEPILHYNISIINIEHTPSGYWPAAGVTMDSNTTLYWVGYESIPNTCIYSLDVNQVESLYYCNTQLGAIFMTSDDVMYITFDGGLKLGRLDNVDGAVTLTMIAGGGDGTAVDGGLAINAQIYVKDLYVDAVGQIYFTSDYVVRKIDTNGLIWRFAGTYSDVLPSYDSIGGAVPNNTAVKPMYGITGDPQGNIYFTSDTGIYRVDASPKKLWHLMVNNIEHSGDFSVVRYHNYNLYYSFYEQMGSGYIGKYSFASGTNRVIAGGRYATTVYPETPVNATKVGFSVIRGMHVASEGDIYFMDGVKLRQVFPI